MEFALTVGLLMLLAVATAQLALFLHYRTSLEVAAQEGAFEAALAGHGPGDAAPTTRQLWRQLEPGGGPVQVDVQVQGELVVVSARTAAPAVLPLPLPAVSVRAVHSIERFQPGSAP
jgi:hypothetical protein